MSTFSTSVGYLSNSVKVFHRPPDAEGHQFNMLPAGSGEDDQF